MMWSEKYRPLSISSMLGNEDARTILVEWFAKWKQGTKPLLVVGPPGIGKTTIANLACAQFGYDMISLNASDVRSKSRINEILCPVLSNISVFGSSMIFVDEVDGIHGRADFGGAEALIKILKESTVPIVLAANSDSSTKMKNIKKTVKTIKFRALPPRLLRVYLQYILQKENAHLSAGSEIKVISESRGDIRSMINLAQSLVTGFNPITEKSFEKLNVDAGIDSFFKAKNINEARSVLYSMRIDPREKINAFYSSIITSKLPKNDMDKMMQIISEADLLYGQIIKTQQWRLLRYLDGILIKLYKEGIEVRYTQYNLSWPLLNRIRWDGRALKQIFGILSALMHVSSSTFGTFYFPFLLQCIKNKTLQLDIEESFSSILEKEMEHLK